MKRFSGALIKTSLSPYLHNRLHNTVSICTTIVPFAVKTIESMKHGKLSFKKTEAGIRCSLPLNAVDILVIKP